MKFLLSPIGSAGDVHPMIGLGEALQQRGHQVVLIVTGYFRELAERVGLDCIELGTRDEFLQVANHPDLWRPQRAFPYLFTHGIRPKLREHYELIAAQAGDGQTVVIASCLGFAARVAQDKLGIPLITLHMQRAALWSRFASPTLPGPLWPQKLLPSWGRERFFRLGERLVIDRTAAPAVNALRRELTLAPVRRLTDWWHSPQQVLCLFPEWYAPPQPDWPPQVTLTHFPLWDEVGIAELPAELGEFLADGTPPIAFTPGSAMRFGRPFFQAAADACQKLGRRGILLSRFADHIPAALPTGVRHFEYVPFSQLLPHCAATVHHGGIGSTAQGLAAGIPQLIMPMAHDQPDNAHRLQRLGVGDWLSPAAFRGQRVATKLQHLLESDAVQAACRHTAAQFADRNGLREACEVLESCTEKI